MGMFAEKREITSAQGEGIFLASLLKDRLLKAVRWLSAPPGPPGESPVWQAGPVLDPADFSEQLNSLQNSLHRANQRQAQPQIKAQAQVKGRTRTDN
jgi:hypothetical protein